MTETSRKPDGGENRSPGGLLRECGRKLTDSALWQEFTERFQARIFLYLHRGLREWKFTGDKVAAVAELTQDVYVRLVKNDARILRSFKGETEYSVLALLTRICLSVAGDFCRRQSADKRQGGEVIPFSALSTEDKRLGSDFDLNTIIAWIDVQRLVEGEPEQRRASRNVLVFKLHYLDGLSSADIASHPSINLTEDGVQKVLQRLRARIRGTLDF